jgi:hypothetical protein
LKTDELQGSRLPQPEQETFGIPTRGHVDSTPEPTHLKLEFRREPFPEAGTVVRAAQKVVDCFPLVSGDDEAAFVQGAVVKMGTQKQPVSLAGVANIGDRQVMDSAGSTSESFVSVADVVGKLKELVQLLDRSLISEQEFAIARKDLLEKGKSAQFLSKTQSPKGELGNANATASRPHAGASKTGSPEKPILWDDSAFSRTLVAAAAKLSALEQVADIRGSWQERPAPGGVPAAARSADARGSGSERMAEWNKLCHDQVQMSSRAAIGAGVRVASQEPPLYAQYTSSVSVSVNKPEGYTVKMYQSSNPMLGPLDFLTNSLNAVSPLGELAPDMMFISSQDQIGH